MRREPDRLEERLPLAAAAMDLPRGRKRPGWKDEFSRAVQEAAGELPPMSEEDIVKVVKQYRRESRVYPEIKLAAKGWRRRFWHLASLCQPPHAAHQSSAHAGVADDRPATSNEILWSSSAASRRPATRWS